MRISLHRSGGLAAIPGLEVNVAIDTATLPEAEASELEQAVHQADLAQFSTAPAQVRAGDRRVYELAVNDGDRRYAATVSDPITVPALRDLINLLISRGRSAR